MKRIDNHKFSKTQKTYYCTVQLRALSERMRNSSRNARLEPHCKRKFVNSGMCLLKIGTSWNEFSHIRNDGLRQHTRIRSISKTSKRCRAPASLPASTA